MDPGPTLFPLFSLHDGIIVKNGREKISKDKLRYFFISTICPRIESCPNFVVYSPYENGQNFLDIQYD